MQISTTWTCCFFRPFRLYSLLDVPLSRAYLSLASKSQRADRFLSNVSHLWSLKLTGTLTRSKSLVKIVCFVFKKRTKFYSFFLDCRYGHFLFFYISESFCSSSFSWIILAFDPALLLFGNCLFLLIPSVFSSFLSGEVFIFIVLSLLCTSKIYFI